MQSGHCVVTATPTAISSSYFTESDPLVTASLSSCQAQLGNLEAVTNKKIPDSRTQQAVWTEQN